MKARLVTFAVPFLLAGCALGNADPATSPDQPRAAPASSSRLVDYAGHPCGNQNLHVKTHPCVFPRR
ncbi:hypothetical protein [Burkholderia stagnalis]|uniref:hypothetical protein n=1 Tax=Burkholderia stagnalis TaxID=1503054 RepID=UPI0007539E1A|nr:hypothetical protein [Burkholderia stagnalis]KVC57927.1 hypothetical protein WS59_04905 [Burkholderia stagnalis]KVM80132.1 hypothetical protein WT05_25930 [Burkholderia stagnalis]KVN19306.1 hypothetical protein WT10_17610 [Burkholderia stagnalis]KWI67546.1 hypothetical protein WT75_23730 [Burkholderia stagnalis]KWK39354.1 hypothetical protein WT80_27455 [Burkholderia stagnalis]